MPDRIASDTKDAVPVVTQTAGQILQTVASGPATTRCWKRTISSACSTGSTRSGSGREIRWVRPPMVILLSPNIVGRAR